MSVRLLWGGGWYVVPNGNLRVQSGGGWVVANNCYVKIGDVGGGYWYDSGYRGYPNPPQGIWVHAWDFNNVYIGFSGPAGGGAPVSYYQVVQTDANGNWINGGSPSGAPMTCYGSPSSNFPVAEDWRTQYYVRSVSTGGLASGWVGPVRVQTGHTEQGYYGNENRTRGWESHTSGARNANEWLAVIVPSSVTINAMHWRNLYTPMSSSVTPGSNRDVVWIFNNANYGTIRNYLGSVPSGSSIDIDPGMSGNNGNDAYWGIDPVGSGWSTTSNGTYMMWCDDLWVDGTETYQVSVYYMTRARAENSYW